MRMSVWAACMRAASGRDNRFGTTIAPRIPITNALINTGDGLAMTLRADLPAQDMEMWQFHPTGIHGAGSLVTEGCRGEGGYLINKDGERFMERYAPNVKDLAGRDVVARSMVLEILEGRGCGENKDHIYLKLDHLGADVLNSKLPGICELSKTFAHVDPICEPIPVVPTCHYMMGGTPTNVSGQAFTRINGRDELVPGLFSAGEAACVYVHGANRLGGNSLLDLVVFGRATGQHIQNELKSGGGVDAATKSDIDNSLERLNKLNESEEGFDTAEVKKELQDCMQNYFGVFRRGEFMEKGLEKLEELRDKVSNLHLKDKSDAFNTSRVEAIELQNLFEVAEATAISAYKRTESRGAHACLCVRACVRFACVRACVHACMRSHSWFSEVCQVFLIHRTVTSLLHTRARAHL